VAEPVLATKVNDGEIIVCCYKDGSSDKVVLRYFKRESNYLYLKAEDQKIAELRVPITNVLWIARVLRPLRSIKIKE